MRRRPCCLGMALFVSVAVVACSAKAATPPNPYGTTSLELLLNDAAVQAELHLSKDQIDKAKRACQSVRHKVLASIVNYRAPSMDKAKDASGLVMERIIRDTTRSLADVLNGDQLIRLKQLDRQQLGMTDAAALKQLNLSPEQREQLDDIEAAFKKDLAAGYRKVGALDSKARRQVFEELYAAVMDKEMAVLDMTQQATWKDLAGEPFLHLKIWHNQGTKPPIPVLISPMKPGQPFAH